MNSNIKNCWIVDPAILHFGKQKKRKNNQPPNPNEPHGFLIILPPGIKSKTIIKWLKLLPKKKDLY